MKIDFKAILFFMTLPFFSAHAAEVLFIKMYTPKGTPVVYEGEFAHVAIKVKGRWLHAHPWHKIQLVDDIDFFGPHVVILENPNFPEPSNYFVDEQLKKSFNIFARWNNHSQTYCSKLVGSYFDIPPTRMYYRSEEWKNTLARQHVGQFGLSPDDVFNYLRKNLNFKVKVKVKASSCPSYLETQVIY